MVEGKREKEGGNGPAVGTDCIVRYAADSLVPDMDDLVDNDLCLQALREFSLSLL